MRELDPGLPARRVRLEHEHVQPFRRAVDGRRETRRPGPDHEHVALVRRLDRGVEAQAVRDRLVGRILEQRIAAADEHGDLDDRDVELIQQVLNVRIFIQIHVRERMVVASEELADAERVG